MMKSQEPWARTSLRIASDDLTPQQIAEQLGRPSVARSADFWAIDLEESSWQPLEEQLAGASAFIREHDKVLKNLAESADVALHVSWSPRVSQDGLLLDRKLLAGLTSVGAYLLLDTYVDME
jgi:hypothetical protein